MVRTPCRDKNGLKKGTWTPEEDRKLFAYVTRYGCSNWRQLPKYAGLSRCGKSCRLRWMNHLRPDVKRGNYTKEEEETIIRLHEKLGNRWSAIAAELPGRSDNEIKNHWHTALKKRMQQNSTKDEAQPNSNDDNLPQHQSSQEDKSTKSGNYPLNLTGPEIMENSTLWPQSSSSDFLSMTADRTATTVDFTGDDIFAFLDAYDVLNENFWTEPFLTDNQLPGEFWTPLMVDLQSSPFLDGEMLCSYGYENHGGFN